jgi:hypothetical protein
MITNGRVTTSRGAGASRDFAIVRQALRVELEARGRRVSNDTVGLRGELYVWEDGDRAAAMFEFKASAGEAFDTMYQGSWPSMLPPRFAVIPASEREAPALEMLAQAGLSVLLYQTTGGAVVFVDMESALAEIDSRQPGNPLAD